MVVVSDELELPLCPSEEELEEPPPHRSLHQSPPLSAPLSASELAGGSGAGSGPADTVTLTRVLNLTVDRPPSPGQ